MSRMKKKIPELSIRRLILYSRYIHDLTRQNRGRLLSEEIAQYFNLDPSQVRKDFSFVGQLGKRGCGYDLGTLQGDIDRALSFKQKLNVILVGCGKLGTALLGYPILKEFKFNIVRAFDVDPQIIRRKVHDVTVEDYSGIRRFIADNRVRTAILAVPQETAKEVAGQLIAWGIKGILNFAPVFLHFSDKVLIRNVDFSVDFNIFRYQMFKENKVCGR